MAALLVGLVVAAASPVAATAAEPDLQGAVASTVRVETAGSTGSGIAVGDTQVLTAAHVVGDASTVRIALPDGSILPARVASLDEDRDLALLAGEPHGLAPITVRGENASLGEQVWAAGSPNGYPQVTAGIVSAVVQRAGVTSIQTDAPVNPGNSGGALVDARGELVGVVVSKSTNQEGVGWATSSVEVAQFLASPLAEDMAASGGDPDPATADNDAEAPATPTTGSIPAAPLAAGALAVLAVALAAGRPVARNRKRTARSQVLDLTNDARLMAGTEN